MKKVAIIGSHGLFAKYGGWDQLVNNLCLKKSGDISYLVFNSKETPIASELPLGVNVIKLPLRANGIQGAFYDFFSIFLSYRKVDSFLLLGAQGLPLLLLLNFFSKKNIVVNPGGVEWERPKFNIILKLYLKFVFLLSVNYCTTVVLDNKHYLTYVKGKYRRADIKIIPYGGQISYLLAPNDFEEKYKFLASGYYLSVSRALKDNHLDELCSSFLEAGKKLVLISNFSSSDYGNYVLNKYQGFDGIYLINGLYDKDELDLVRRNCFAYVHTHTLCGTAPSLVEMIVANRPIFYIDVPQNRHTMKGFGIPYTAFDQLSVLLKSTDIIDDRVIATEDLVKFYSWDNVVRSYESLY